MVLVIAADRLIYFSSFQVITPRVPGHAIIRFACAALGVFLCTTPAMKT